MVAKEGINTVHLCVILVDLKKFALQLIRALAKVDAIAGGKYLYEAHIRLGMVTM
jgi:hypothetical protein